jgi:hypothetical protein
MVIAAKLDPLCVRELREVLNFHQNPTAVERS